MNKNISEEVIEIDGTEYTLFLNRTGLVSWEKLTNAEKTAKDYNEKYATTQSSDVEITDDMNPLEVFGADLDEDLDEMLDMYVKFYWVVLYTHHKLPLSEVKVLFEKAVNEYGIEQLAQLANQMIEQINTDMFQNTEIKNLKALKPKK